MNKSILIINQQHTSNLGDRLIGSVMKQCFYEYNVDFLPYIPNEKFETLDKAKPKGKCLFLRIVDKLKLTIFLNDLMYYFKILKLLKNKKYGIAIIGGGELISGNLEFNSALFIWTKILCKKNIPVIVAGVSGNKVSNRLGNRYKKALSRCELVYVRDWLTKKVVEEEYGLRAEYCPDFVFSFKTNTPENKENIVTAQIYCYEYADKSAEITNREMYFEQWYCFIKKNLDEEEKLILSYSDKDDKQSTISFKNYVYNKHNEELEISDTSTVEKMIELLSKTKKIVSGRMHPMILGKLCHNEVVPFIVKEKIKVFHDEWGNKGDEDIADAARQIEKLVQNIKSRIKE